MSLKSSLGYIKKKKSTKFAFIYTEVHTTY
jgi:hypothetical protein